MYAAEEDGKYFDSNSDSDYDSGLDEDMVLSKVKKYSKIRN